MSWLDVAVSVITYRERVSRLVFAIAAMRVMQARRTLNRNAEEQTSQKFLQSTPIVFVALPSQNPF